ncbi:MAG: hypothetical protein H6813_04685 [Phycisphaeraceae bacterium]|nr:hypothetical protein [Phycisphaeraceae bacterium]MCB9847246.1 hypothetical protein [Phycisphaeraceae bacterium]
MSSTACYFDVSAETARLFAQAGESRWTPAGDLADDDPFAPRKRLQDIAMWLTEGVGSKKRIDLFCLGVSDSMCQWLSAPSAEMNVVAAAARGKGEEWGPGAALGTIEPLTSPHQKAKRSEKQAPGRRSGTHFPVLAIHDAPARVLLDALDRDGIRVGSIVSLWHAMCRAWDESLPTERVREELKSGSDNGSTETAAASPITAILVTTDDNALVWVWSRGRQLVTGGRAALIRAEHIDQTDSTPTTPPSSPLADVCGRLALDWLTWSAQLGQTPERIIIISPDAREIATECERLWPTAPARLIPEIDPVKATIDRLSAGVPVKPEADARTCIASLTNRPGRAHRRLNQWVGVILLGVAIAIIGLGFRLHAQAGQYQQQERSFQAEIVGKLGDIDQRLARDPRPLLAIDNKINQLATTNEGFEEPALPLPILTELMRVATALQGAEGVKIERIEITETRSTLRLQIPDTVTGERVIEALRTSDGKIRWIESAGPLTGRLVLNGAWTVEEPRL